MIADGEFGTQEILLKPLLEEQVRLWQDQSLPELKSLGETVLYEGRRYKTYRGMGQSKP